MSFKLRPSQLELKGLALDALRRVKNVLCVYPTGGGKTVIFSDILLDHRGASCVVAHRQEIVSQISLALARDCVRHKIIGPPSVVRLCVAIHMAELGRSYYDPGAQCAVAGVDTIIRRKDSLHDWMQSVTLWIMDEAHHVLAGNKWGIAVGCFPQARGLGFTATACRNDGHGLGADTDGVFHDLLQTDGPRDLINRGYLTDYKIYAPLSDIKLHTVPISAATGDFNAPKLKIATRESHIVGDVIDKYVQYAKNKLDVVFATDCETAQNLADKFNASGIPAAMVHAETPDRERIAAIRKFKARRLLVLVNVDLFGEGFDLPAIEAVSMARPTKSYALFAQQFGRALRLLIAPTLMEVWDTFTDAQRRGYIAASGKPYGIIIDHVNNVLTHGLPDAPRWYSLERRERKAEADPDVIPLRTCPQCVRVYERFHAACPYCGFKPQPAERSGPEFVDGDLCELSPDVLAQLRGDIDRVDMSPHAYRVELARAHVPIIGQMANVKRHILKQEAQSILREALAWWAGHQRAQEMSDSESYKRFYFKFGTDVMSAQALGRNEALVLAEKIHSELEGMQKGR